MSDYEYNKEHYDDIKIHLPKGKRDILKDLAAERHLSINALVIEALEQTYGVFLREYKRDSGND